MPPSAMRKVAIVGAGPTGLYTFCSLLRGAAPLSIAIYEKATEAGVGMPYNDDDNMRLMLANIASIEIPPLTTSFIDWLRRQDAAFLVRYGVEKAGLHERQFLPRVLLGEYFRSEFLELVAEGRASGFEISVHESCPVDDLEAREDGVLLWAPCHAEPRRFDHAIIATGHVWPAKEAGPRYFPSPWSGLLDVEIPACRVGIKGTSLSGIDAALVVAAQHGHFVEQEGESLRFQVRDGSAGLAITLMSRSGLLPEADFYCPIPYEPLQVATSDAIQREIDAGSDGLLDRVFALMVKEIEAADPAWTALIALPEIDADGFADAYFANRYRCDAFRWAEHNLKEVERNRQARKTVPWRYAILRLHEAVQIIISHLDEEDRRRFYAGLSRVFVDNYAAIPPESIRRLLALHEAGVIALLKLGPDYQMAVGDHGTLIHAGEEAYHFDMFIDARGQPLMKTQDLPFPRLRRQLLAAGEEIPDVSEHYLLLAPDVARGRIAFGALPYLMHDKPFIQGITACANMGKRIAEALSRFISRGLPTHGGAAPSAEHGGAPRCGGHTVRAPRIGGEWLDEEQGEGCRIADLAQ